MRTMNVSEAKDKLSQLVEAVGSTHDAITITRHGKAAAVLVSADDLQQLTDTVEWLNDPLTAPEVAEATADIADGRTLSVDDARTALRRGRQ
ncbi:type II toxin-antitoxin system Phd/YefM family antitoxin [Pseudactinotalea terrae]|uniref:type II toxin-antitoxin system Phd/YefM family antitoxin n=1 Tax=Pseudactinotalea terrae TaxID=1743262 RepID=UPI0012E0D124|nr:type II toxin-antitoxin system Phd/YefM family antitoxin [Pseudactinotalea terrae]